MKLEDTFIKKIQLLYRQDTSLILKAFEFANQKHNGMSMENGEAYITHPFHVAETLIDLHADTTAVICGFIHDCINSNTQIQEIEMAFGTEVANICNGLSRFPAITLSYRLHTDENENLQKMILALGKDARVAMVKLAERLHDMQTLDQKPREMQIEIANETLDLFVPITERMSLGFFKHELEDLCFRYLYPQEYSDITNYLNDYYKKSEKIISNVRSTLESLTQKNQIDAKIQSRLKSAFGVFKKTLTKSKEQIYDIIAHRVIVPSIKDCYTVLGAIHEIWKPVEGRIKDYISHPKKNNYRSLHTTVLYPFEGREIPVEIQIRTEEMHVFCEYGMAAHWIYKQNGTNLTDAAKDAEIYNLKKSRMKNNSVNKTDEKDEYHEVIKSGFFTDKIFVFTPNLNVIELPDGSITLDFAYAVHTNIGNHCTGAKVNEKMVPINYKLTTGDIVEILTNNAKTPSRDWLKMCKSSGALAKLRAYLKKEFKEDNIKIGHDMLEEAAKRKGLTFSKIIEDKAFINIITQKLKFASLEDIYAAIGYGGITATSIISKFESQQKKFSKRNKIADNLQSQDKPSETIFIDNQGDLLKSIARCCNPIPGDEIIGFVSKGRGIIIHKKTCKNISNADKKRLIAASWNENQISNTNFSSSITIRALNDNNIYAEITNALSEIGIKVTSIESHPTKNGDLHIKIGIQIKNKAEFASVKNKLLSLAHIYDIFN